MRNSLTEYALKSFIFPFQGDTLLYSYHCNFDQETICGWVNAGGTWTWGEMNNPPGYPFPPVDGTHGIVNTGHTE